jgi:hypothetical protein
VKCDNYSYPRETRWFLKQLSTGTNIVEYGFDEVDTEGLSLSQSVNLIPGQEYRLAVRDSVGDGIYCDYGEGAIAVYATVDGVEEVLASTDEFFEFSYNKKCTVPESYARGAQKDSTACIDSAKEQQFHVDEKVGNKGCEWLSMNIKRFDYMCEFVDVASICPKTCNSCHLFS